MAITGITIAMPYLKIKSLLLNWNQAPVDFIYRRFHLRVPNLHMSCRSPTTWLAEPPQIFTAINIYGQNTWSSGLPINFHNISCILIMRNHFFILYITENKNTSFFFMIRSRLTNSTNNTYVHTLHVYVQKIHNQYIGDTNKKATYLMHIFK